MSKRVFFYLKLCLFTGLSTHIHAQTGEHDPAEAVIEVDEISAIGVRNAILSAIDEKRAAEGVVEFIAAEDIGRLPEYTITESLARLPGLSSGRNKGNGSDLTIRGLGTELTTSLMNGRELATHNTSRSPRFDQFPTELIHGASVSKTLSAKQLAGGIAGSINLNTIRPLTIGERKINVNANFEYQELAASLENGEAFGDRESFSYIDQFLDGRLGVALGLANSKRPVGTVRAAVFAQNPQEISFTADNTEYRNVTLPFGYESSLRTGSEERQGLVSAIEFGEKNGLQISFDLFYSAFSVAEDQSGLRTNNLSGSGIRYENIDIIGGSFDSDTRTHTGGSVRRAELTGAFELSNINERYREDDELLATGVKLVWPVSNAWRASTDLSYSSAERVSVFTSLKTLQNNPNAFFDSTSPIPLFTFGTALTNTEQNTLPQTQLIIDPDNNGTQNVLDDIAAITLDFERKFRSNFFTTLDFGLRNASREKEAIFFNQTVTLIDGAELPEERLLGDPLGSFSGDLRQLYETNPTLRFDVQQVLAELYGSSINPGIDGDTRRRSWLISENVLAAYAQLNFEKTLFRNNVLSGNVGLRYEATDTDASSIFFVQQTNEESDFIISNSFFDVLPSLNLTLDIDDTHKLRLHANRAIARPAQNDLNPGLGAFSVNGLEAFSGNPELEPYRANQLDLSYERYLSLDTAFSITLFLKEIDTVIVTQALPGDVDLNNNGAIENPNGDGLNESGTLTQPRNLDNASIQGLELSYNQAFTNLRWPFNNLGVYATVSVNNSDLLVQEAFNKAQFNFPGFAESYGNATLWYAGESFEMKFSYRFVNNFIRRVDGQALAVNTSEAVMDMQANYYLNSALQLLFQAKNLTDEPYTTHNGDPELHGRYEQFGRSFTFGFSLSL